ncbi:hypothetical protein [Sulfurimonas sp. HSL-1716]|uniref:hypothetical protein n=1 Tax=Hydrocurvibacter sulfurireducens TaxID=3131937 RepID=UPI0031F78D23
MAFVLELKTSSSQDYIKNYIISIIREHGIKASVHKEAGKIVCALASGHKDLQGCVDAIARRLPASCFLTGSAHYETKEEPQSLPSYEIRYPLGLGLCPSCQKEIFDPSSRRYYYPFTPAATAQDSTDFLRAFPMSARTPLLSSFRPAGSASLR